MHPRDGALGPDIAGSSQYSVVCTSGKSYHDLILLCDDRGGSLDEFMEDGSAFRRPVGRSEAFCQDLVERTGDDDQL